MTTAGERTRIPVWVIAVALVGAAAALAGGFWDDTWHTERGRDTFFAPPHLAIYAGLAGVGAALGLWVLQVALRQGVRAVLRDPILLLATGSVAVTLAGAPIDSAWHEAFGRDAVGWSPPHMLGVVGSLGLGAALLASLGERRVLGPVAGALVFAAATFAVFEYETDVPQFDAAWYLPVLATGAAIAGSLVHLASARPWAATSAALVHLVFLGGVSLFLLAIGFPPPALPLLVFPAAALDVARRRGWPPLVGAALFVGVVYAVYVPVRNLLGDGVLIDAGDVAVGLPVALLAVAAVFAAARGRWRPGGTRVPAAATAGLVVLLLAPSPAVAHDPGQGEAAGSMRLEVIARGGSAELRGTWLAPACRREPDAGAVVARRAGRELRAPLRLRGCSFQGRVPTTSRGRWFIYAELRAGRRRVESWLPVRAGAGEQRAAAASRYAYVPPATSATSPVKYAGGGVLYGGMAALLLATLSVLRRRARG